LQAVIIWWRRTRWRILPTANCEGPKWKQKSGQVIEEIEP
jgi:hypothetical protein